MSHKCRCGQCACTSCFAYAALHRKYQTHNIIHIEYHTILCVVCSKKVQAKRGTGNHTERVGMFGVRCQCGANGQHDAQGLRQPQCVGCWRMRLENSHRRNRKFHHLSFAHPVGGGSELEGHRKVSGPPPPRQNPGREHQHCLSDPCRPKRTPTLGPELPHLLKAPCRAKHPDTPNLAGAPAWRGEDKDPAALAASQRALALKSAAAFAMRRCGLSAHTTSSILWSEPLGAPRPRRSRRT